VHRRPISRLSLQPRVSTGLGPLDQACVALSAIVLGHALQISNGFYSPVALKGVGLSLVLLIAGAMGVPARVGWWLVARRPATFAGLIRRVDVDSLVSGVLLAGILSNLLVLAVMPPAFYIRRLMPYQHPRLMAGLLAATILSTLIVVDRGRARRVWFPAILMVYLALGAWLIDVSPQPKIDVVTVHRAAIDALLSGESPYSVTFQNIYRGGVRYYSTEVVEGSRVLFGLPYPPLSLLMVMPGDVLADDIRWAELAALVAGAGFIASAGAGQVGLLAATLLLFTPRTFFVLEQAWTESLAICWLGATVYAAVHGWRWLPLVTGLLVGVKQHLAVTLLFTPWLTGDHERGPARWRLGLQAAAVAAACTLPFIAWDPTGFWRSVVWLQFVEPFRLDSLSVLSHLAWQGWRLPEVALLLFPLGALIIGGLIAWRWLPRDASGFALSIAIVLGLVFAFSKKAFCNYYFFLLAAMVAGLAAAQSPTADSKVGRDVRPARRVDPVSGPTCAQRD
jgi:hypothetical protein